MENTIKKEELKGFRKLQPQEQKLICDYYVGQKKKSDNVRNVWKAVCIFFLAFFVLGMLGLDEGDRSIGEWVVLAIVASALVCVVFMINKAGREAKGFIALIEEGQCRVMDCMVYKTDTATNMVNKAIVYIYNQSGQYCDERFPVDRVSVNEWIKNGTGNFWLVKVLRDNTSYYELFTPRKLNN